MLVGGIVAGFGQGAVLLYRFRDDISPTGFVAIIAGFCLLVAVVLLFALIPRSNVDRVTRLSVQYPEALVFGARIVPSGLLHGNAGNKGAFSGGLGTILIDSEGLSFWQAETVDPEPLVKVLWSSVVEIDINENQAIRVTVRDAGAFANDLLLFSPTGDRFAGRFISKNLARLEQIVDRMREFRGANLAD